MAYIFLRGRQEPLEVEQEFAVEAEKRWQECCEMKLHEPIKVGNSTVLTSEIKAFQLDTPERKDTFDETIQGIKESRRKMLSLSPTERAETSISHFMLALNAFCGKKEISDKQKQFVISKAKEFFEKNPRWTVPSLKVYKPIFDKLGEREDDSSLAGGVVKVLERVEQNEYVKSNFTRVI